MSPAASSIGLSHVALASPDLERTRTFYEDVLGLPVVREETHPVREGGRLRHIFFAAGGDEYVAFHESRGVPGVPDGSPVPLCDRLGIPGGFYHVALQVDGVEGLERMRSRLREKGVALSDVVDHGWCQATYFRDPHGNVIEVCAHVGPAKHSESIEGEPVAAAELWSAPGEA